MQLREQAACEASTCECAARLPAARPAGLLDCCSCRSLRLFFFCSTRWSRCLPSFLRASAGSTWPRLDPGARSERSPLTYKLVPRGMPCLCRSVIEICCVGAARNHFSNRCFSKEQFQPRMAQLTMANSQPRATGARRRRLPEATAPRQALDWHGRGLSARAGHRYFLLGAVI